MMNETSLLQNKKRTGAFVSSYLILKQDNKVLLLLRQNTGYCDGQYGLVSGHVEEGEAATVAMIREAQEEAGIEILPSRLKVCHIMHRKSGRLNIDIFFECQDWQGSVVNREPEKCAALEFFPQNQLPVNTIDYIAYVLKTKDFYSEQGWDSI